MRKLRLVIFNKCNRDCAGCCNKEVDYACVETETDFCRYDICMITGGEPMLEPDAVAALIGKIGKSNPNIKVILYTAKTWPLVDIIDIFEWKVPFHF